MLFVLDLFVCLFGTQTEVSLIQIVLLLYLPIAGYKRIRTKQKRKKQRFGEESWKRLEVEEVSLSYPNETGEVSGTTFVHTTFVCLLLKWCTQMSSRDSRLCISMPATAHYYHAAVPMIVSMTRPLIGSCAAMETIRNIPNHPTTTTHRPVAAAAVRAANHLRTIPTCTYRACWTIPIWCSVGIGPS